MVNTMGWTECRLEEGVREREMQGRSCGCTPRMKDP